MSLCGIVQRFQQCEVFVRDLCGLDDRGGVDGDLFTEVRAFEEKSICVHSRWIHP